jgi:putative membrane-bound dehydrogenase-like protein
MDVEAPGWKPKVKIGQAPGQARELNTRCAPLNSTKPSCVMIRFAILAAVLPATLVAEPGSLSPAEALGAFQVEPGARVELAAAEPLVRDPVALCFGDVGRMFVVEGRSYPQLGESPLTLGTVALLEDADGDGRFEKRTTFADGFTFPNGILPWGGGVFLTCAPDIWFLKDTTGDGRADVRQIVLTGFGTESSSEQLRVASPTLGPDGWVYITSGLTDAKVTSPLHPSRPAVTAKRQDGRFHPETFVYEPLAGVGQFGQCFDALGHRFVSSNRNPLMHVVLSPDILKRNPHFAFTETVENVVPVAARVYPISPDTTAATYIPSLINQQHTGTYTSASGICIRGGSAFICEPAQNLVQRQRLRPSGATFLAEHPTPGRDFLASPDQWFRPVHAIVGPDGALYVCDMVRQYIDHPRYLPEPIRGKLPFRAGTDKGRIWRVVQLGVVAEKQTAEARAAALKTLQLSQGKPGDAPPLAKLERLANSPDARLRFQAALQLAQVQDAKKTKPLAQVLSARADDKWTRAAVFSSMGDWSVELLDELANQRLAKRQSLAPALAALGQLIAKTRSPQETGGVIARHLDADFGWRERERTALLGGIIDGSSSSVADLVAGQPKASANVGVIFESARAKASSQGGDGAGRLGSIALLGHSSFAAEGETLLALLSATESRAVRLAAAKALGRFDDAGVAEALLAKRRWGGYAPGLREGVTGVLLGRSTYHPALMAALESGVVPIHALSPARRGALERSKPVGARAKKLFAKQADGDRMKVYELLKPVLKLKTDATVGAKVFTRACALCHTHGSEGYAVGPDLTGLRNQPAETLLLHIIVPNHEVVGGNTMYEVDTKDGQIFAGLLAADTPAQLTLKLPLGFTKTLARSEVKAVRASPLSLMPNELEKTMTRQELANLIAFLKR